MQGASYKILHGSWKGNKQFIFKVFLKRGLKSIKMWLEKFWKLSFENGAYEISTMDF